MVLRIFLSKEPSLTIKLPPLFFQAFATSSRTPSAVPRSRHPEPQCLPMKVASDCKAGELRVRLCFFVKVRKAKGLRLAGGRRIGRMVGIEGLNAGGGIAGRLSRGLMGWTGVPKAGLEDGTVFSCRRIVVAILRVTGLLCCQLVCGGRGFPKVVSMFASTRQARVLSRPFSCDWPSNPPKHCPLFTVCYNHPTDD